MLRDLGKLFNTECRVLRIGKTFVYPIFRVGSTSLKLEADQVYINEEIGKCDMIDIFIRDPETRFVSGINKYCRIKNSDVEKTWRLVSQNKLIDRHFVPQFYWLMHLSKFYKGDVRLRPFSDLKTITKIHLIRDKVEFKKKINVPLLKSFVDIDHRLSQHYNQTINLPELIKRYKHELS